MAESPPTPNGSPVHSPWREWLTVALARLRALSGHRMSVWFLLGGSGALFLIVLFVAVPTARIRIVPKVNLVSYTANVLLSVSGASLGTERRYPTLPLLPIRTTVRRSLTFDQVSRYFLGTNAETQMTLVNEMEEETYSLRPRTRLVNQAGMIFRTLETANIPAATPAGPGVVTVRAEAESKDQFGEVMGERGNVPPGLKWELPALPLEERTKIYARNLTAGTGGTTAFGNLLRREDLALAEKQLHQELLQAAKSHIEEELELLHARTGHQYLLLQYDVLTSISFSGGTLPAHLIGTSVRSIPLEGALAYAMLAYSKDDLLVLLLPGLREHIEEGHELVEGSVLREGISVHVIEYDDHLQWVKITAELTGKQRATLSVLSPSGRLFAEKVRTAVRGKTIEEARRIVQNFPEVDRVDVSVWPPWQRTLPSLVSNIVLLPQR